jgi:hypothetical protein
MLDTLAAVDERLSGPFDGVFLATYAVQAGDGYIGYSKLCDEKPSSVWEAPARFKVASLPYSTVGDAMHAAEACAQKFVLKLAEIETEQAANLRNIGPDR